MSFQRHTNSTSSSSSSSCSQLLHIRTPFTVSPDEASVRSHTATVCMRGWASMYCLRIWPVLPYPATPTRRISLASGITHDLVEVGSHGPRTLRYQRGVTQVGDIAKPGLQEPTEVVSITGDRSGRLAGVVDAADGRRHRLEDLRVIHLSREADRLGYVVDAQIYEVESV